jgi:uncharacterized membrane protein YkvI
MMGEREKRRSAEFFHELRMVQKVPAAGIYAQSVLVAGGYGTGRELVEYFGQYGRTGGSWAWWLTFVLWAALFA